MDLKQKVMSGLRWTAGAKFLSQLITWAITIVVIRLLSPADFGLLALAMVFVAFLAMLNELGLGAAVVQRKELDENVLKSLFGLVLVASVVFYLVMAVSGPLIAGFYDEPRLVPLIRVLALQFILMGFSVLPQSLLLREMKYQQIAISEFIAAISGSLTTLALALTGHGVWALVWGSLIMRFVSMVCLNVYKPFLCMPRTSMAGLWAFFSFGGYVTLARIFRYFFIKADILIVGKVLGKDLLGFYSVGFMLASLPLEKVSGIINQVAFPAFSSIQSDPGLAGRHFLKAVRIMSFIAFPVFFGISSIAPEIIGVLLGDRWLHAALPMQIIALVIPVLMVSNLMDPAARGKGHPQVSFHNALVAFIIMPAAFFAGSFWGLFGVSLAWVICFPMVFCLNLWRVVKVLEIRFLDVFLAMQMPFMAGLAMYAGVYIFKIMPVMNIQLFPKLLILAVIGAVIYFFLTIIFNRDGLYEVWDLVKA